MSGSEYILCENCGTKVMYTELAVLDETRPIVYCVKCYRQLQAELEKHSTVIFGQKQHEANLRLRIDELQAESMANEKLAIRYYEELSKLKERLGIKDIWHNVGDTKIIKQLQAELDRYKKVLTYLSSNRHDWKTTFPKELDEWILGQRNGSINLGFDNWLIEQALKGNGTDGKGHAKEKSVESI